MEKRVQVGPNGNPLDHKADASRRIDKSTAGNNQEYRTYLGMAGTEGSGAAGGRRVRFRMKFLHGLSQEFVGVRAGD